MILSNPSYDVFPLNDAILRRIAKLYKLKDLHDRAIVSTALELNSPLITKDSVLKSLKAIEIIW